MGLQQREQSDLTEKFMDGMAHLASGVAVVSARCADGRPCGLLVSSVCSHSVDPPALLVSLARSSRTYGEIGTRVGAPLGVHVLGAADAALARTFAGDAVDKFTGVLWSWDGAVPRLSGVPVYLRCRVSAVFPHGDHAILVVGVTRCDVLGGAPLIYFRRRLDWRLT
jgi:flavin reductase (DIM6/NTAB) family NADH-FMN oxidoreductase RutF